MTYSTLSCLSYHSSECKHAMTTRTPRQVADLEEERRKLNSELKFRAKYHGEVALTLGLTPEQLLLLEQYTESLKHGTNEEANLVDQLTKRVSGAGPCLMMWA